MNFRTIFIAFTLLAITSCNKYLLPKPSFRVVDKKDCIVWYEFEQKFLGPEPTNEFCIKAIYLELPNGEKISFHDDYSENYRLLEYLTEEYNKVGKRLKSKLISEKIIDLKPIVPTFQREPFLKPEFRLGDSKFKYEVGNVKGNYVLKSNHFYQKWGDEFVVFLVFKIDLSFFFYEEVDYYVEKKCNKLESEDCYWPKEILDDNFAVLKYAKALEPLDPEEQEAFQLKKLDIDRIGLYIIG